MLDKLEDIANEYSDYLSELEDKFSSWADRIASLIGGLRKK